MVDYSLINVLLTYRCNSEQETCMATKIPNEFRDLFEKKAFGHLATVMKDGSPQVTPVWCDYDGTHVRINSAKGRIKDKNMRRNRHVALSIQDPENPFRCAAWTGCRDHRQYRRSHQRAGKEIHQPGQVPLQAAERSPSDLQDSSRSRAGVGEVRTKGCTNLTQTCDGHDGHEQSCVNGIGNLQ